MVSHSLSGWPRVTDSDENRSPVMAVALCPAYMNKPLILGQQYSAKEYSVRIYTITLLLTTEKKRMVDVLNPYPPYYEHLGSDCIPYAHTW